MKSQFILSVQEELQPLTCTSTFTVVQCESGEILAKGCHTKIDAANAMYSLIKATPEKYSTEHSQAELYGYSEPADIEALQTPTPSNWLYLETLDLLEQYQDKIIACVKANDCDIKSPASVKLALTGCAAEKKLIIIAMFAFKVLGQVDKTELQLRLERLTDDYMVQDSVRVYVTDLKQARAIWKQFVAGQEFNRYTGGGDVYKGDEVVAVFSFNGRCWQPSDKGNEYYPRLSSSTEITID